MSQSENTPDNGFDVAKRTATIHRVAGVHAPGSSRAYDAHIKLFSKCSLRAGVPKSREKFAFITMTDDMADEIRGEVPDVDGTAVMLIGEGFGKNYHRSEKRTVPVDLLEKMQDNDMVLVRNVDGGWAKWEGRPEWSTRYIDFSDAEVVDMQAEIDARRE